MKKILITGWAWFVGSNLCRKLLNDWYYVVCVDNLSTWTFKNIKDIHSLSFTFKCMDIEKLTEWKFDEIYNLACPASPKKYQSRPLNTIRTNILWIKNCLELWLENDAKVLQASTSEVYWDAEQHPQKETYFGNVNSVWIRSCYDEGKRIAETLCVEYNREYFVKSKIVRIFNTYWPYMDKDDGRVVSNFICQALQNKDITIYGDWLQTRSFQYVDDLVDWLIAMMNKDNFMWPVNIGTSFEFTIKDFAEKILSLIPESKSKLVYLPLPKDDPKQRRADNSLAKKELNREPKVWLDEWLLKTIKYFKSVLNIK